MPGLGSFGSLWISISSAGLIGRIASAMGCRARSGSMTLSSPRIAASTRTIAGAPGDVEDPAQGRDLVRDGGRSSRATRRRSPRRARPGRAGRRPWSASVRVQGELERGDDAEAAVAAAQGPEELGVACGVGADVAPSAVTSSIAVTLLHARP